MFGRIPAPKRTKANHNWVKVCQKNHSIQLLNRRGRFWEREYFDTLIRDGEHLKRAIRYAENNPVKAALAAERKAWQWASARWRDEYERLPWQRLPPEETGRAPGAKNSAKCP